MLRWFVVCLFVPESHPILLEVCECRICRTSPCQTTVRQSLSPLHCNQFALVVFPCAPSPCCQRLFLRQTFGSLQPQPQLSSFAHRSRRFAFGNLHQHVITNCELFARCNPLADDCGSHVVPVPHAFQRHHRTGCSEPHRCCTWCHLLCQCRQLRPIAACRVCATVCTSESNIAASSRVSCNASSVGLFRV